MKKTHINKICIFSIFIFAYIFTACSFIYPDQIPTTSPTPVQPTLIVKSIPTDEYINPHNFGDGYIARIPIKDFNNAVSEEIVKALVTQWLEHYKTQSQASDFMIKDYTFDQINLLDNSSNSGFEIVAGVRFSIIPAKIPNEWASFPGDTVSPNDIWWHLGAPFGVFREEPYFVLKLVFGLGT